ncbi:MAG: TIM barrel protein [Spirochaetaceae bacterium]|nr:TIM barrel protein [Spirochaetaceae bacterium]
MRLGLVSNVWNVQLAGGEDLCDLVGTAARRGFRVIELRQRSLGRYESADEALPDVRALGALAAQFPNLHFVAAYEVPFLDPGTAPDERYFAAAAALSRAVANGRRPHVRLVDLRTSAEQLAEWGAAAAGRTIASLAAALREDGAILSVENSRQPWPLLAAAIDAARAELGANGESLRVCFDPCNFAAMGDRTDPASVYETLTPEQVGMLHFKQRRAGTLDVTVAEGAVDWPRLVPLIVARRLFRQGLFEMASDPRLWDHLEHSSAYLRRLWRQTGTDEPWGG